MREKNRRKIAGARSVAVALTLAMFGNVCARANTPGTSWHTTSSGYRISWTHSDLRAIPESALDKTVFSARGMSRDAFFRKQDPKQHSTETREFDLLSMVGTIMSYQDRQVGNPQDSSRAYGETKILAIDLKKAGLPAKLTDIFFPEDIFSALINDKVVQRALEQTGAHPTDLDGLLRAFGDGVDVSIEGNGHSPPLCFHISQDLLSQFAFHHIDKQKVWVRIGLSGAPPCRYEETEIGITLPMPQALEQELQDADKNSAGLLMKDSDKHARQIHTVISLDSAHPPKRRQTETTAKGD